LIKIFKNDKTESGLRIGVGIPCHVRDLNLLSRYSLPSAFNLDPAPDVIAVNINRGEGGHKKIRTDLFNTLFEKYDCDIVFNTDADMIVLKDALKYIREDKVVSYGPIYKTPIATIINLLLRFTFVARKRKEWRGTYSLPRKIWFEKVRNSDVWAGFDSSLKAAIDSDFDCVPFPKVLIVRRHSLALKQVVLYHPYNRDLSTLDRVLRLARSLNC
jgi:hypothetical protein